MIKIKDKRYY